MSSDAFSLTALVPGAQGGLIDIYDQYAALTMTVVERECARNVDPEWDEQGAYVLLVPTPTPTG